MKKNVLIALLFQFSLSAFAQANSKTDSLLCKEWKMVSYEDGGEPFEPLPGQENDRMIFYFDHTLKSKEANKIQNGTWEYDSDLKILTIIDNESKEKMTIKVIKLTSTECVIEFNDPDGIVLKVYMAPVDAK